MPWPYKHGVPATRRTPTRDPRTGDTTWTPAETWQSCAFDPGGTVETDQLGNAVVSTPTLYGPPGVTVTSEDEVIVAGGAWEVDGDPKSWTNPYTGTSPGTVVKLTWKRGAS